MGRRGSFIYPVLIDPASNCIEVEEQRDGGETSRWHKFPRLELRGDESYLIQDRNMVHFFGSATNLEDCQELAVYDAVGRWCYHYLGRRQGRRRLFDAIMVPPEVNGAAVLQPSIRFFLRSQDCERVCQEVAALRTDLQRGTPTRQTEQRATALLRTLLRDDCPNIMPVSRLPLQKGTHAANADDGAET